MKKLLGLTATLFLTATGANANTGTSYCVFNGWGVGLDLGWVGTNVAISFPGSNADKMNFGNGLVGGRLEWMRSSANSLLYGMGFGLGSGFSTSTQALISNGVNMGSVKLQRTIYGEMTARLGYNANNLWAFYGLLAGRVQKLKVAGTLTETGTATINFSQNKAIWGWAPGFGVDAKLSKTVSVGVEYKYYFEQNMTTAIGSLNNNLKINSHNIVARLTYHF